MSKPFMVAIAGGSGSGKTTIASLLAAELGSENVVIVSQDHYYRDLSEMSQEQRDRCNFDHPGAFDNELLYDQLTELQQNKIVHCPIYDFKTHTRTHEKVLIQPTKVIIFDGILALSEPKFREIFDLKVYVDVPDDVRILRRLKRDITGRGRTVDSVVAQYIDSVKPMHQMFVEPSKWFADIVVAWGKRNQASIYYLAEMIKAKLQL